MDELESKEGRQPDRRLTLVKALFPLTDRMMPRDAAPLRTRAATVMLDEYVASAVTLDVRGAPGSATAFELNYQLGRFASAANQQDAATLLEKVIQLLERTPDEQTTLAASLAGLVHPLYGNTAAAERARLSAASAAVLTRKALIVPARFNSQAYYLYSGRIAGALNTVVLGLDSKAVAPLGYGVASGLAEALLKLKPEIVVGRARALQALARGLDST